MFDYRGVEIMINQTVDFSILRIQSNVNCASTSQAKIIVIFQIDRVILIVFRTAEGNIKVDNSFCG